MSLRCGETDLAEARAVLRPSLGRSGQPKGSGPFSAAAGDSVLRQGFRAARSHT